MAETTQARGVVCPTCRNTVPADAADATGHGKCPACGELVRIYKPTQPKRPSIPARQQSADPSRALELADKKWLSRKPIDGYAAGILLVIIGIVVLFFSAIMDVGGGARLGGAEVANLDKMNQRTNGVLIGAALLVAGIIELGLCNVRIALWRQTRLTLRKLDKTPES